MTAVAPDRATVGLAAAVTLALLRSRRSGAAAGAEPSRSAATAAPDRSSGGYDALVERLRATVVDRVPAGADVLVVSRGDPRLVELGPCHGRHFPADELGVWAGHHPALGTAAALLAAQRGRADHLAVPATASWWFDTYPELSAWLATGTCLADDPDTGSLWRLPPRVAATAAPPAPGTGGPTPGVAHLAALVGSLCPTGGVLVISRGDPGLLAVADGAAHFPAAPGGHWGGHPRDDAAAVAHLRALVADGARWLVVPEDARWWADAYAGFWDHLRTEHRFVTDRPGTGVLVRLAPHRGSP